MLGQEEKNKKYSLFHTSTEDLIDGLSWVIHFSVIIAIVEPCCDLHVLMVSHLENYIVSILHEPDKEVKPLFASTGIPSLRDPRGRAVLR